MTLNADNYKATIYKLMEEHTVQVLSDRFDVDYLGIMKDLEDNAGFSPNEAAVHIGGFLMGMEYACRCKDEVL